MLSVLAIVGFILLIGFLGERSRKIDKKRLDQNKVDK